MSEFIHDQDGGAQRVGFYISPTCPDCGKSLKRADGEHVIAGVWQVYAVLITCTGRRVIPLPAGTGADMSITGYGRVS
jgi:hypothetical protein